MEMKELTVTGMFQDMKLEMAQERAYRFYHLLTAAPPMAPFAQTRAYNGV